MMLCPLASGTSVTGILSKTGALLHPSVRRRRFEKAACEVLRQASVRRRHAAAAKARCWCLRRRRVSSQVSMAQKSSRRLAPPAFCW